MLCLFISFWPVIFVISIVSKTMYLTAVKYIFFISGYATYVCLSVPLGNFMSLTCMYLNLMDPSLFGIEQG